MRTKKTTLSFLTESKAPHVSLLSIRRVAITLLVMLLTTASAWAQFPTPTIYRLYLHANHQGCAVAMVEVTISVHTTYTLTSVDEPTREGYIFCGWSTSSTGDVRRFMRYGIKAIRSLWIPTMRAQIPKRFQSQVLIPPIHYRKVLNLPVQIIHFWVGQHHRREQSNIVLMI